MTARYISPRSLLIIASFSGPLFAADNVIFQPKDLLEHMISTAQVDAITVLADELGAQDYLSNALIKNIVPETVSYIQGLSVYARPFMLSLLRKSIKRDLDGIIENLSEYPWSEKDADIADDIASLGILGKGISRGGQLIAHIKNYNKDLYDIIVKISRGESVSDAEITSALSKSNANTAASSVLASAVDGFPLISEQFKELNSNFVGQASLMSALKFTPEPIADMPSDDSSISRRNQRIYNAIIKKITDEDMKDIIGLAKAIAEKDYEDAVILISNLAVRQLRNSGKDAEFSQWTQWESIKSISTIARIASAKDNEEVKAIIQSDLAPPGTFRRYHEYGFHLLLNGYLGGVYGRETGTGLSESNYASAFAPVGLEARGSTGYNGWGSWGLNLSAFDLGSLLSQRLDDDDQGSSAEKEDVDWSDVFAPGAFVTYSPFIKVPLTIGFGYQYAPNSRIDAGNNEVNANRYFGFIGWHVPLLPLY